jgi:hypothetical protein
MPSYVIAGKVDDEDGTLYWSNADGWGFLSTATVFTAEEFNDDKGNLPLFDDEARWVELPDMQQNASTDAHGTLNPAYKPAEPRFLIYVKNHEPDEEPDWQHKLEIVDRKYLDSDSLPITSIAGGATMADAFGRAHDAVVTALSLNHCTF